MNTIVPNTRPGVIAGRHRKKASIILYLILYSITNVLVFSPSISSPVFLGYALLIALFLLSVIIGRKSGRKTHLFLILTVSFLMSLIVIDPVETGLYGHDPYTYTLPALETFNNVSPSTFINVTEAFPLFYSLSWISLEIYGSSTAVVAKYLPMIILAIPLLFYAGTALRIGSKLALFSSLCLIGTKTFYLFEVKFIEEPLAMVIYFTIINLILLAKHIPRFKYLLVISSIAVSLSHPTVAVVAILLLGAFAITRLGSVVPSRFKPRSITKYSVIYPIIIASGMTILVLFTGQSIAKLIFGAIFIGSSVPTSAPTPQWEISSLTYTIFLILQAGLAVFVLSAYLSHYRFEHWQLSFSIHSAVMLLIYLLLGPVLITITSAPIDSSRVVLYYVPILILVFISIFKDLFPKEKNTVLMSVFLVIFLSSQVLSMPPHVLYSDPGHTTVGEGHYTQSQFQASSWVAQFSSDGVVGFERGLWESHNNTYLQNQQGNCTNKLFVQRSGVLSHSNLAHSAIYDSGNNIKLYTCTMI